MKNFKAIILIIISIILTPLASACSKNDSGIDDSYGDFVGVAFYQKTSDNHYERYRKSPAQANNLIVTKDNKISYTEKTESLFYIYSTDKITSSTSSENLITNTISENFKIESPKIYFNLERISENTNILIYYIYKTSDSTYMLLFQKEVTGIVNEETTIELAIKSDEFNQVVLTLSTNLASREKY